MSLSRYITDMVEKKHVHSDSNIVKLKKISRNVAFEWWENSASSLMKTKIRENFEMAMGIDFLKFEYDFLKGLADHYAEKIFISNGLPQIKAFIENISVDKNIIGEIISTVKEKGKNVLMAACHFGGVELIAAGMLFNGIPTAAIANYNSEKILEGHMDNARNTGIELIPVSENMSKKILFLKNNPRALMTVSDAFDYWKRGKQGNIESVIFGKKCNLDYGMDRLVKILNAEVYWCYMKRNGLDKYDFEIKRIKPQNGRFVFSIMNELEALVKKFPDEYYGWYEMDTLFENYEHSQLLQPVI